MRLFTLIFWMSSLFCVLPAFAQNQTTMSPAGDESPKEYNARWVEVGSQCINTLLTKAKLKRKHMWNDRFPDLKTLCLEYERYWYFANLYADGMGIPREKQDLLWIKSAFEEGAPKGQYPYKDLDLKVIQKFRQEIDEFAGSGSALLVDGAIPRFNPGQVYALEEDKSSPPVADGPWQNRFDSFFIGDFYPLRKRFWGDLGKPGRKD